MAKAAKRVTADPQQSIAEITVAGFKSISDEQSIEVRPLTILAGANSSGKSSMMQPLLLLKQTLQATYDPGPLLLNGPNVKFTSADQLLARTGKGRSTDIFQVGARLESDHFFQTSFRKEHGSGFGIDQMTVSDESGKATIWPKMTATEIRDSGVIRIKPHLAEENVDGSGKGRLLVGQERCFLELTRDIGSIGGFGGSVVTPLAADFLNLIVDIIHLPGLRGSLERTYPTTAIGSPFPGTFDKYTASVISHWEAEKQKATLAELNDSLKQLALTGGVTAVRINDVQIELHVGRLPTVPPKRPEDRVNIADVGIGVSQVLPVVTALLAARPGQLVYLEQPEIHLHPRAQVAMARILANAANRGVRVVAETHSSLLLLGVQSLVAEGELSADKVKLHWFSRNKTTGATTVTSADLDEAGRFGEWPEDFDDVTLQAQKEYLDSAERRLFTG
jgi:hypothetical protein